MSDVDPRRIGLIVGGSTFSQQRELTQVTNLSRLFAPRRRSVSFMDSICGFSTAHFGIRAWPIR